MYDDVINNYIKFWKVLNETFRARLAHNLILPAKRYIETELLSTERFDSWNSIYLTRLC